MSQKMSPTPKFHVKNPNFGANERFSAMASLNQDKINGQWISPLIQRREVANHTAMMKRSQSNYKSTT